MSEVAIESMANRKTTTFHIPCVTLVRNLLIKLGGSKKGNPEVVGSAPSVSRQTSYHESRPGLRQAYSETATKPELAEDELTKKGKDLRHQTQCEDESKMYDPESLPGIVLKCSGQANGQYSSSRIARESGKFHEYDSGDLRGGFGGYRFGFVVTGFRQVLHRNREGQAKGE